MFRGVQNEGCRVIVHTCRLKVSPKNDGLQRRKFKKWPFKPKIKKSLHTPSHRLRMCQTCCTFMVPKTGIEPVWISPQVFETCASTYSAIWALFFWFLYFGILYFMIIIDTKLTQPK